MADTWTTKTSAPTAKRWLGAAVIGTDKAYALCGANSAGSDLQENAEYSKSGDSWSTKTAYPVSDDNSGDYMRATAIGTDNYYALKSKDTAGNPVREYSQSGNSWTSKATIGLDWRGMGASTLDSDKAHFISGQDSSGVRKDYNRQYSKSGDSFTTKTSDQGTRKQHAQVTINSKIHVISGDRYATAPRNAEYTESSDSWASKADPPIVNWSKLSGGGCVVANKAYIWGGDDGTFEIDRCYEYGPSGDSWTQKTNMPAVRTDYGAATIGSYDGYNFCGGDSGGNVQSNTYEYAAVDPPTYDALEDLQSFLDAQWPIGLDDLKAALEAHGWSLEDLKSDVQAQAYTSLEDLKAELGGNAWGLEELKAALEGHAQALEHFRTDISTSNLILDGLRCELKTRDTHGPYVFNYPSPAPGQTGVPVNSNITIVLRDDGWGVDINTVWVEVDGVRYKNGDAGFSHSGTPRKYTITIDPTTDFEYNRSVNVKAFAADLAGNPGLNLVTQ